MPSFQTTFIDTNVTKLKANKTFFYVATANVL